MAVPRRLRKTKTHPEKGSSERSAQVMHACRKHTALPKGHEVLHNDDTSMRVLALRRAIAEEVRRTHRHLYLRRGLDRWRTQDRSVLHGATTCGRELGRCTEATSGRATHADSDVGCTVAKCHPNPSSCWLPIASRMEGGNLFR